MIDVEKYKWKGDPSHNPDKGWIVNGYGKRITRLGGRFLYGKLIQEHNNEIDLLFTYATRAQPKYKRVDLNHAEWLFMQDKPGYKEGYNRAIDDIKYKYGDLYVVIEK